MLYKTSNTRRKTSGNFLFILKHRLNDLPSPIIYNKFDKLYFGKRCIMRIADLTLDELIKNNEWFKADVEERTD